MIPPARIETSAADDTGVADVRRVREKIAAQYAGDLRKHVAETHVIVQPLIEKLGLKQTVPALNPATEAAAVG